MTESLLKQDYITRKELVNLSPLLTYDLVRRRERALGLFECRIDGFHHPILYRRSQVVLVLIQVGILTS